MRALRAALCTWFLAAGALLATPPAAAHPVTFSCTEEPTAIWVEPYVHQFDPTDPNTWFSTIVRVFLISDPCQEPPVDYPFLCFAQYERECTDARHPIWVLYCWLPDCDWT
jgi:hypothetical protein